ncbi:hypothetical protein B5V88_16615 [Heyndrickxia sporothermodurans]|nr:hypothetical protein B5V88_16615 [Heyndrickxia sporothermodurans]PTY83229.1 hypothetical protein B5V91_17435 [Heyndrickxia sporothermodurans]
MVVILICRGEGMERRIIRYCAIGDSLTVGIGSDIFSKGFITRYVYLTRQALNTRVHPAVFGKTGATTGDILKSLNHPFLYKGIKEADIITITAGGNDLIDAAKQFLQDKKEEDFFIALEKGKRNLEDIIKRLTDIKQNDQRYIIRMMNLYNPFPEIKGVDKWVEAFNHNIESLTKSPLIKVADIHHLFMGKEQEVLSSDHIHPNHRGYCLIANALTKLGYDPL